RAPSLHDLAFDIVVRAALERVSENPAPGISVINIRREQGAREPLDLRNVRQQKSDRHFKAAPYSQIEQLSMVGRGDQDAARRPVVHLLKQDADEALELAYFAAIVAAF